MLSLIRYVMGCGLISGVMFGGVTGMIFGHFVHGTPAPGVSPEQMVIPLDVLRFGIPAFGLMLGLLMAVPLTICLGYEMHKRVQRDDLLWKLMAVSSAISIMTTFATFIVAMFSQQIGSTAVTATLVAAIVGCMWMILPQSRLAERIKQTPFMALDA